VLYKEQALNYPAQLPVVEHRQAIVNAIRTHRVLVLAGETGSGKTTQLPKFCLEAGLGEAGLIGHTQPRRLAARAVATRLAEELQQPLGGLVGYQVRFAQHMSEASRIKVMTDGILLAEIQQDPLLRAYECLIIDEAHERSLNIDFLLGYLRHLMDRRPDLKIIITSATIDTARFARHFLDAPVIEVSGRTYPVEVRYRPVEYWGTEEDLSIEAQVGRVLEEIGREPGDVLVFLPGEREIRETAEYLRKCRLRDTDILPLYARLSGRDQHRIFSAHAGRRIVLSTNIAETSLTVPGIRFVIDPGLVRISRYSHRARIQRLPIEPVAQASANQRAGRCGRVGPGIAFRLYAETDFLGRPAFTEPELKRTNLASVVLQMKSFGLGDMASFPFLEPPDGRLVRDGVRLLEHLGALNASGRLTRTGKDMCRFPTDPRLSRILVEAARREALAEACVIISALSIQDPRERPADRQQAADEAQARFHDGRSDFTGLLKLWEACESARAEGTGALKKFCQAHYLSFLRVREWRDVHRQLVVACHGLKWQLNKTPASYAALHQSLLTGFISYVGHKEDRGEYQGCHQRRFFVHPSSGLAKKSPAWIMAAEMVETTRLFARMVAAVEPEWIEMAAGSLLKRHWETPVWRRKTEQVMSRERTMLQGLVLVADRWVNHGARVPDEARAVFVQAALVAGEINRPPAFLRHNLALMQRLQDEEARLRRPGLAIDEDALAALYLERLPASVYDGRKMRAWLRRQGEEAAATLFFSEQDVRKEAAPVDLRERFPDSMAFNGIAFPLEYHFAPGEETDGIRLRAPEVLLDQLDPHILEWGVPGQLEARVTALIRGLPKRWRKSFAPAPEYAKAVMERIRFGQGDFLKAVFEILHQISGVEVPDEVQASVVLPEGLGLEVHVVDDRGRTVGQVAPAQLGPAVARSRKVPLTAPAGQAAGPEWLGCPFLEDGWSTLPETLTVRQAGLELERYPGLVLNDRGVPIWQLYASAGEAEACWEDAFLQALCQALVVPLGQLFRQHFAGTPLELEMARIGRGRQWRDELCRGLVRRVLSDAPALARPLLDRSTRDERIQQAGSLLAAQSAPLYECLMAIMKARRGLDKRLSGKVSLVQAMTFAEARSWLDQLMPVGFIGETPVARLADFPRYLEACEHRLEKCGRQQGRDLAAVQSIERIQALLQKAGARSDAQTRMLQSDIEAFRWMIEELRVSLFAQHIRTRMPVSEKRLRTFARERLGVA
jgi:ATP-dependent helicase HrpA